MASSIRASIDSWCRRAWEATRAGSPDLSQLRFPDEFAQLTVETRIILVMYVAKLRDGPEFLKKQAASVAEMSRFTADTIAAIAEKWVLALGRAEPSASTFEESLDDDFRVYATARHVANLVEHGPEKRRHENVAPAEIMHEADKSGIEEIRNFTGFDTIVRKFSELCLDQAQKLECLGTMIQVTPRQLPKVYYLMKECQEILRLPVEPSLFLQQGYLGASTFGVSEPCIVLNSGMIGACTRDELMFAIGHEMGHIHCQHLLYSGMAAILPDLARAGGLLTLGLSNVVGFALEQRFGEWQRNAELSADRFGLLACQNPGAAVTTILKLAGAPVGFVHAVDLAEYQRQAEQIGRINREKIGKAVHFLTKIGRTHPFHAVRVTSLLDWARSHTSKLAA